MRRGHAARNVVIVIAPHEKKIGRRQHGHCHAGIGEAFGNCGEPLGPERRQFGDVTDRHAAAPARGLGAPTDLFEIHPRRIDIEIEMKIDIAVELPRYREDTRDLAVRIAVGVGTAADEVGVLLARRDEKLLGAWIVEQAFLRKNADFDIDRPGVVLLEPPDGVEPFEPYARVDLDMGAHAHGALQDGPLQRAAGALINVVFAERALGRSHFGNRLGKRSLPRLAAVEDAGLVEVDMRFDEAGDDQFAVDIFRRRIGGNVAADIDDTSAGDGDIDSRRLAGCDAGIAQDQVESHAPNLRQLCIWEYRFRGAILACAVGGDESLLEIIRREDGGVFRLPPGRGAARQTFDHRVRIGIKKERDGIAIAAGWTGDAMRRRDIGVVAPPHQAVADVADEGAGNWRRLDPCPVTPPHFKAADIVGEQDRQAAVIGVFTRAWMIVLAGFAGRVVQQPQRRHRAIELVGEEVARQRQVRGNRQMQIEPEPPQRIEIADARCRESRQYRGHRLTPRNGLPAITSGSDAGRSRPMLNASLRSAWTRLRLSVAMPT